MAPYKPDFILANCPGCAMFLDRWQYTISEMEGTFYGQDNRGIPVLTYEELAGLVLGYDPWELGMQMHQVAVEPLLDKMGDPVRPVGKIPRQKRKIHRASRPPRRSDATRKPIL